MKEVWRRLLWKWGEGVCVHVQGIYMINNRGHLARGTERCGSRSSRRVTRATGKGQRSAASFDRRDKQKRK